MTTLTSISTRPSGAAGNVIELRSGPHTAVGCGETCLVCGDPLSPGEVYLFVAWTGSGVAHEDCAEFEAAAASAESDGVESDGGEAPGHDPVGAPTGDATRDGGSGS